MKTITQMTLIQNFIHIVRSSRKQCQIPWLGGFAAFFCFFLVKRILILETYFVIKAATCKWDLHAARQQGT